MTIIAGFKCFEGVVICADTLETMEQSKRHVQKLRFLPDAGVSQNPNELAVIFCGSGYGPFIDKVIELAWKDAKTTGSLEEACDAIERSIKVTYEEYGRIYQPGERPTVELLYGVKMEQQCKLFTASGPLVSEKDQYDSSGAGYWMADFLSRRMHSRALNIHQCVILAAYILFQAKEHVDGCGGSSDIAILRSDGVSGYVDAQKVKAITEILEAADQQIGEILLSIANLDVPDEQFRQDIEPIADTLDFLRSMARQDAERRDKAIDLMSKARGGTERIKRDSLGLPIPPDFRKSEDQQ